MGAIIALVDVTWIEPDARIGARRGDTVVCIPVYGGHEHFAGCLGSVLAHTPAATPILVCDDASPDGRSVELVRELERSSDTEHTLFYLRLERNVGFPANVNGAFAIAAPADVVVLNSDCVVAEGWLEGLREAAYSDSRVATATALTNNGTIVSVPDRRHPRPDLPDGLDLEQAAAAVRRHSRRLRPQLPTAIGHCAFIRRTALELVGDFDLTFSPGYGEEVDFSQRCLQRGLAHVLADDVLVLHHGAGSFSVNGRRSAVQEQHERILAARYPYYHEAVRTATEAVTGPLQRALGIGRRALIGLEVVLDARKLAGPTTGTQVQTLELIAALARSGRARVTVVVPGRTEADSARALSRLPDVELVTRSEIERRELRADIVHRPYQVDNEEDLAFLGRLGERLIVTNQDLIAYRNPAYFRTFEDWEGYRRVTRTALAASDRVVFVSAHARDDALAEELAEPDRASVVHNGIDHAFVRAVSPTPPTAAGGLDGGVETIVCLGTDFRHKNRLFALRLLDALRRRHRWEGRLVFVGPRVSYGSSIPDEEALLADRPDLAAAVIDLKVVSEAEKAWLLGHANLVIYPTVHEGFGLIPFEAADHGVPCLWAPGTSLSEILPDSAAAIVPWDAEQTAAHALGLLRDDRARGENLDAIRTAARPLTWDAAAERLLDLYERTCDEPAAAAAALERQRGVLGSPVSEDAMRLIGPGGALPAELERPLLALATHPQVGKPLFGAIRAGYRVSHRLRRWGTR
jgi:GT2 family glycosyltransferase/glycosyltransferase involved in cell wall biosynthesis